MKSKTKVLIGLVALAAIAAAAYLVPIGDWLARFVDKVQSLGLPGALIYAFVYVAGTVLFFPGTILTAGSGFLYGPVWGTVLVSPSSVLGATLAFLLARSFVREWVERRIAQYPRFKAIDAAIAKNGFKTVLLLRLQPVNIPFTFLNYALGLTRVRLRDYVLASWIGMLPASILYVYVGSLLQNATELAHGKLPRAGAWERVFFLGGLIAAVVLVIFITRISKRALQKELNGNSAATSSPEEVA